jgi:FKBP-type peptidyl-prolyl cis-trans isomerase FkpA
MKTAFSFFPLLLALSMMLFSCTRESQSEIDESKIQEYIKENKLEGFAAHSSGVWYKILVPGSGGNPNINSTVTVNYKGYLLNNKVFDQTTGSPREFRLNSLIQGWQIGIPLLQKGGKGIFLIPSALGYGTFSQGDIPGNSVLVFEIELVTFR